MDQTNKENLSFRTYREYLKHYFPDTVGKDTRDDKDDPRAYGVRLAQESVKKLTKLREVK